MPGMEKQRSYLDACIVLLSKRRLITYRPCSFSVLGGFTLSIEEVDMRDGQSRLHLMLALILRRMFLVLFPVCLLKMA